MPTPIGLCEATVEAVSLPQSEDDEGFITVQVKGGAKPRKIVPKSFEAVIALFGASPSEPNAIVGYECMVEKSRIRIWKIGNKSGSWVDVSML